jgi:uncharacterized protein with PIN domain
MRPQQLLNSNNNNSNNSYNNFKASSSNIIITQQRNIYDYPMELKRCNHCKPRVNKPRRITKTRIKPQYNNSNNNNSKCFWSVRRMGPYNM